MFSALTGSTLSFFKQLILINVYEIKLWQENSTTKLKKMINKMEQLQGGLFFHDYCLISLILVELCKNFFVKRKRYGNFCVETSKIVSTNWTWPNRKDHVTRNFVENKQTLTYQIVSESGFTSKQRKRVIYRREKHRNRKK